MKVVFRVNGIICFHYQVLRDDKITAKVRVAYDAQAKSEDSTLNKCSHKGL